MTGRCPSKTPKTAADRRPASTRRGDGRAAGRRGVAGSVAAQRRRTLAPPAGIAPLAGYTVAVASDRRRHPLAALLVAAGARTLAWQSVRAFSAADDPAGREGTAPPPSPPIPEPPGA